MGALDSLRQALGGTKTAASGTRAQDFGSDQPIIDCINALEPEIEALDDAALAARFAAVRARTAADGRPAALDASLEEVFALVREATFRVLGLRHYDVQLLGGLALHRGCVAEMATGEGKTIAAALPAALNALQGASVLVVTVNDYLAQRDAATVGSVLRFLGLSVGAVQGGMSPKERREVYAMDVAYVTNSELGFDYLRDNLAFTRENVVLERPLGFCIVDEADSILIDEARTPLIISGKVLAPAERYATAQKAAVALEKDFHYTVSEKEQSVLLTDRGYTDLEGALKVGDLFDPQNPWAAYIGNALKAKELFKRDVNYIVADAATEGSPQEVQIVDEFTGRVMPGRRWSDGLHQAVEAKEGISVASEAITAASVSYQAFFCLFDKLAGMTGTASTETGELKEIYGLDVVEIPTALPCGRKDYPDVVFKNADGKLRAVMGEIARVAPTGRPVLVGTTSVEASEALSALLTEVDVPHEVLNAKPESALRESEIIAQAGRKFSITIATNMAGRGTDILLGGNADYFARALARRELVQLNEGLLTELIAMDAPVLIDDDALPADVGEESMQALRSAAAAVVKGGTSARTLAEVDELVAIAAEYGPLPPEIPGLASLAAATRAIRDELEETVSAEREEVLALGGLYIVGTERAESRRVDRQLRGRAGRQGDPGSSRFILALDDRLFKLFGGEKVAGIMETFRVGEDLPLENRRVSEALDAAQGNVEGYFGEIRGQLFQYDQVLAKQRAAIYSTRRRVRDDGREGVLEKFREGCVETSREIVRAHVGVKEKADDFGKCASKLSQFFAGINPLEQPLAAAGSVAAAERVAEEAVVNLIDRKRDELDAHGDGVAAEAVRYIWLTQIDTSWTAHMKAMDYLKEFAALRSYANDDPLQAYQEEGFGLFREMEEAVRRNTVFSLFMYQPAKGAGE